MAFFQSAVGVLQTLVIALGAGLGIWGVVNLMEGYSKFGYLFKNSANNRIIINVINIHHTSELINALLKLYKNNSEIGSVSIEINYYYMGTGKNDFEQMCDGSYIEKIATTYYGSKNVELIEGFCDWYVERVFYYAMPDQGDYKYAHISFCAMQELSNDAKMLYGLMLDRMGLSSKNNWFDEENRVFVYYSMEDVMDDLNCSKNKALKSLSELDTDTGIGLIERVKQGQGKPAKIYIKNFLTAEGIGSDFPKKEVKRTQNGTLEYQKKEV